MAYDIFWDAIEPDLNRQKLCCALAHAFFTRWREKCGVHDGHNNAALVDYKMPGYPERLGDVPLYGVTVHHYKDDFPGWEDDEEDAILSAIGEWQYSFVFLNGRDWGEENAFALVSVEQVRNFRSVRYGWLKPHFEKVGSSGDAWLGVFNRGGYIRSPAEPRLFDLFYLIQRVAGIDLKVVSDEGLYRDYARRMDLIGYGDRLEEGNLDSPAISEILELSYNEKAIPEISKKIFVSA